MTFYWRSGRTRLDLPMQRSSGLCRLAWLLAVALIALLFGAGAPAQALSQPLTHLHHYVYDADVHHSDLTSNATERGPPTAWDTHQGRTAVGRASNGALASPATATVSVSYDYDGRPQFVQVAQSGNTDPKPVGAPTGQFSSAHPSQVAANAGSSLAGKSYGLGTVVENPGLAIQGFRGSKTPGHTINRIINRGVSPSMLRDTVANPKVVLRQGSGNYYHLSDEAAVVLRPDGQVVTAYGRADFKQHVLDILADVG